MRVFRGLHHGGMAPACALTIGNFDGVHRGHQAMLALLRGEAAQRGVESCVLTFEPHPRDFFAARSGQQQTAPARIGTLRDKLTDLAQCGVDQTVVLPFDSRLAGQSPQDFIDQVLLAGLGARYVLVGDDFRFGARRQGDYAMLDAAGDAQGFDVARMNSYEVHGLRVSSSAVRDALAAGRMDVAARLLGRPYRISGHVVHGLSATPLPGVANLGVRPSLDPRDVNGGRVLLETHCLQWPAELGPEGAYGKIIRVELLHKLHDERKYDGLEALQQGIAKDCDDARTWLASMHAETHRQTTRDRI